jgi:hypothetical protein
MTHHKLTLYFYDDKKRYIHSILVVVLCLPFHVHNPVENVFKHVFFNVHENKVMEKISFSIRKILENTLLYPIVGQTKTRKLLLIEFKTKHNVIVL